MAIKHLKHKSVFMAELAFNCNRPLICRETIYIPKVRRDVK